MKVNRKLLCRALEKVNHARDKGAGVVADEYVNFMLTHECVAGYNGTYLLYVPFELDIDPDIKIWSPPELLGMLKGMKEDTITFSFSTDKKGSTIKLRSKMERAKLNVQVDDNKPFKTPDKFKNLPKNFLEGLKMCQFSTSKNDPQLFLNCIGSIDNYLISGDDTRFSRFELSSKMQRCLIPSGYVPDILSFKPSKYVLDDHFLYLTNKKAEYIAMNLVNDTYPKDLLNTFDLEDHVKIDLPEEMMGALEDVSVVAGGDSDISRWCDIKITSKSIMCSCKNDKGEFDKKISCMIDIDSSIEFSINPLLAIQILKKTQEVMVADDRLMFVSDNFNHVMAYFNDTEEE